LNEHENGGTGDRMKLPVFVSFGEALTDLIRTSENTWTSVPGGSPWNLARAASALGIPTGFAGAISNDAFGDQIYAASKDASLHLEFLQRYDKAPLIAVVRDLNPPDYFFLGNGTADMEFDVERLPKDWSDHVQLAHFGSISLARPPLGDKLFHVASDLKRRGVRISYDPNVRSVMGPGYIEMFRHFCHIADLIKVSNDDLHHLYDGELAEGIAEILTLNQQAMVLYTEGERGATLYRGSHHWSARPPKVNVIDTVGAGDTANAALLYSLLYHPDRREPDHLRFAVAAGAAACRQRGAAQVALKEIEALFGTTVCD
jgi:fructokinase